MSRFCLNQDFQDFRIFRIHFLKNPVNLLILQILIQTNTPNKFFSLLTKFFLQNYTKKMIKSVHLQKNCQPHEIYNNKITDEKAESLI